MALINDCVFCDLIDQPGNESVHSTVADGIFRIEPLNPVVPGHMLFVSWGHYELPQDNGAVGYVFEEAAHYAGTQGVDYNLIVNAGPNSGQTVKHMHIHYVPRFDGDGLKMPWTEQQERGN